MKTPGYENEMKTKPEECKAIETNETLYDPDFTAKCIISGIKRGEYHISCGDFGCNVLVRYVVGMTQRNNLVADIFLAPISLIILTILTNGWYKTARDKKFEGYHSGMFDGIGRDN